MKCGCLANVRQELHKKFDKQAGGVTDIDIGNVGIVFGEETYSNMFVPVTIKGNNKPFSKQKGEKINLFFTYCPFCGKKVKEDKS